MTYNSSIAIAFLCLAPVDEETSSAAQQNELPGRQLKKGGNDLAYSKLSEDPQIGRNTVLSTSDRRRLCYSLWDDQAGIV